MDSILLSEQKQQEAKVKVTDPTWRQNWLSPQVNDDPEAGRPSPRGHHVVLRERAGMETVA